MEKLRQTPLYPVCSKIYVSLHKGLIWTAWQLFSLCPIQKGKIIFSNFNGKGFGDNPRYIAEELIRQKCPVRLYWVLETPGCHFPPEITTVRPNTLAFVYHMSTAQVWVDDTRKLYYFKKKKNQTYIMTWHAGPGLKRVEQEAGDSLSPDYIAYAKRDSQYIDLVTSNSQWLTDRYQKAFWYDGPILEKGIPKNDLYFRDTDEVRKLVRKFYKLPQDAHLVLYVPTWRENRKLNVYHLDFEGCLDAFEHRFGGTWYMLVRLHPNVNPADFDIHYTDRVLNASPYENVQELLAAGDAAITDYSSCGFDYIQLGRPSFLYAEDYEEMKRTKDYYFQLEELPTPLAFSNDEMIRNILEFSEETYEKERIPFLEKVHYYDDGHASEAIVDYIMKRVRS
jgi:CDP-glycerol glycerophosphotransferase